MGLPVVVAVVLLTAGCGDDSAPVVKAPAAPPISARTPDERPIRPAQLGPPIARYKRWVDGRLAMTASAVVAMRGRIAAGDLRGARREWARASRAYASVGAAYGAFGALDRAINGTADGLSGGERDRRFSGLHRVELALWKHRSLTDARAASARLDRAVRRLRARLPKLEIDPAEFVIRAHEVLEDSLHLEVTGHAARYSDRGVDAIAGQAAGARVLFDTLRPLLHVRARSDEQFADAALARLSRTVAALRRPDGGYPPLNGLSMRGRERLAGTLGAAAEALAPVPEALDTRAPIPVRVPSSR